MTCFHIGATQCSQQTWMIVIMWDLYDFIIFFSQVIEFVQFKERLQRSDQYLVARLEASILQLKQNADNIEEEEV